MSEEQPGLLLVMMDPEPGFDGRLNRWYAEEHLAERMSIPGFLSGRRFVALEGGKPKYVAMYELTSPAVLQSEEYLALGDPSPWTVEVRKHTQITRNLYVEITPKIVPASIQNRKPATELWRGAAGKE